jgi:hypothetical protein
MAFDEKDSSENQRRWSASGLQKFFMQSTVVAIFRAAAASCLNAGEVDSNEAESGNRPELNRPAQQCKASRIPIRAHHP